MDFYILHDPNKSLPDSKRFIWMSGIRECKKVSKKQIDYLLGRIYKTCRDQNIRAYFFSQMHPWRGFHDMAHMDDAVNPHSNMLLNPRWDYLITHLHEMIHFLYADATEGEVLAMERQIAVKASDAQWHNIKNSLDLCFERAPYRSKSWIWTLFEDKDFKNLGARQRREFKKGMIEREYMKEWHSMKN